MQHIPSKGGKKVFEQSLHQYSSGCHIHANSCTSQAAELPAAYSFQMSSPVKQLHDIPYIITAARTNRACQKRWVSILRSEIDAGISSDNTLDKTRSHQTCLKSSIGRDSAGVPVRSMAYFAFCKSQNTIQGVRENQCLYKKSLNLQGSHPLPPTTLSPPEDSLGFRVSGQGRRPLPEEGAHMHWCVLLTHFSNSVIHRQLLSVTTQHCMSNIRCNQYLSFASYVPVARPLTKLK